MRKTGRHGARSLALQALYQVQLAGHDRAEVHAQFTLLPDYARCESAYFDTLLDEVYAHRDALDEDIAASGDIRAEQVDPVERAVLWIALAELRFHDDVPAPVVINEAVELAKCYGAEGGHRYVNGLLDKAARKLRAPA